MVFEETHGDLLKDDIPSVDEPPQSKTQSGLRVLSEGEEEEEEEEEEGKVRHTIVDETSKKEHEKTKNESNSDVSPKANTIVVQDVAQKTAREKTKGGDSKNQDSFSKEPNEDETETKAGLKLPAKAKNTKNDLQDPNNDNFRNDEKVIIEKGTINYPHGFIPRQASIRPRRAAKSVATARIRKSSESDRESEDEEDECGYGGDGDDDEYKTNDDDDEEEEDDGYDDYEDGASECSIEKGLFESTTQPALEHSSSTGTRSVATKKRKAERFIKKERKTERFIKKEITIKTEQDDQKKCKTKAPEVSYKKETAVQTEQDDQNVDQPPKKKKKGPRVSEAVIHDAAKQMLKVLIENYKDGIKKIPMDILAASITNKKGKPYTNHRSDAVAEGMKRLKELDQAEKIKHGSTGAAKLSMAEIAKIPKETVSKDPRKVLEQRRKQFLERLARHKKGGTGTAVVEAANAVWNKLEDGNAYSRKELVAITSYKGTNSSGFEGIMKVLSEMNLIEGKGKSKFTDKVFPHGRP